MATSRSSSSRSMSASRSLPAATASGPTVSASRSLPAATASSDPGAGMASSAAGTASSEPARRASGSSNQSDGGPKVGYRRSSTQSSYMGSSALGVLKSFGVAARQLIFVDDPDKVDTEDESAHKDSFRIYDHNRPSFATQSEASDSMQPPRDALDCLSQFVMTESNTVRKVWEFVLLFLLLYIGIVFPYRLAFEEFRLHAPGECVAVEQTDDSVRWELFVTVFFWIDLFLGFFLTHRNKDDVEVTAPSKIAKGYLRSFFFINLLACLPESAFRPLILALEINPGGCIYDASANGAARLARLQRVTRLARLARVLRIVKVVSFLQRNAVAEVVKVLRSLRLLNWIVSLSWIVHLLACGWYLVAALHENHLDTWVGRRVVSVDEATLISETPIVQWAHSMYFILTVFTTVGFGDMSAVTIGEILYVALVMMVGAIVHSIIISEMINLISEVDEDTKWKRNQVSLLEAYSSHAGLDRPTRDRLTGWVNSLPSGRSTFDPEEMRRLLTSGRMPRRLLGDMPDRLFSGQLQRNKLVRSCAHSCLGGAMPPRFSLLLSTVLNIRTFKAKDVVFELHDHVFNLFLVVSGTFAYVGEATEAGGFNVQMDRSFSSADNMPQMCKQQTVLDTNTVDAKHESHRADSAVSFYHTLEGETVAVLNPCESSRSYSSGHNRGPRNSVLGQTRGAWSPERLGAPAEQCSPRAKEWVQINMGSVKNVSGVSIQGHPLRDEWATRVKVYISHSGISETGEWEEMRIRASSTRLNGSLDHDTKVEFLFREPRMAQFVRIEPLEWHGERVSMRAAVLVIQQRLYPYQLIGAGDYFGEDVLLGGNRTATARCEAESQHGPACVMLLHKHDLTEKGSGAKLLDEFPQFWRVMRSECLRLQARRRAMLRRLCRGLRHDVLAACTLQAAWRQRSERRARKAEPFRPAERGNLREGGAERGDRRPRVASPGEEGQLNAKVDRLASELGDLRADMAERLQSISSALEKLTADREA